MKIGLSRTKRCSVQTVRRLGVAWIPGRNSPEIRKMMKLFLLGPVGPKIRPFFGSTIFLNFPNFQKLIFFATLKSLDLTVQSNG